MKKLIALLLAALMLLALCACQDTGIAETEPSETQEILEETEDLEIPTEDTTEEIPAAVLNADMAMAESCIDKPVEELYELIGEPQSADYAPSCLNPGVGEDGNLYYDGFVVYTYREGETETVQYVEEAE